MNIDDVPKRQQENVKHFYKMKHQLHSTANPLAICMHADQEETTWCHRDSIES